MNEDLVSKKSVMRARLASLRDAAFRASDAPEKCRVACERVAEVLADTFGSELSEIVLSGYMPMRSEIDPLPAMIAHPGPVCVPVIAGKGQPLEFHRWHAQAEMIEGAFKARIPAVRDALSPRALIVPLLAFDRRGYRLGYGGGFYDRTLERLRAQGPILAVGIGFEEQEVAQVPTEPTDQRLDLIVTPVELLRP